MAKSILIYSIYEVENYDSNELNEQRINAIKKSERILRLTLKRLSLEEELAYLKEKFARIESENIEFDDNDNPQEII